MKQHCGIIATLLAEYDKRQAITRLTYIWARLNFFAVQRIPTKSRDRPALWNWGKQDYTPYIASQNLNEFWNT